MKMYFLKSKKLVLWYSRGAFPVSFPEIKQGWLAISENLATNELQVRHICVSLHMQ